MQARENPNPDEVAVTIRILIPRTDTNNLPDILRKVRESVQDYPDADVSLSTMRVRPFPG